MLVTKQLSIKIYQSNSNIDENIATSVLAKIENKKKIIKITKNSCC